MIRRPPRCIRTDTLCPYATLFRSVRASGVPRDEILVTTKIPGRDHGYDEATASARRSLQTLGLDRIDLYLIPWPNPSVDQYVDTWRAMLDLRGSGLVRSIGGSKESRGGNVCVSTVRSRCPTGL